MRKTDVEIRPGQVPAGWGPRRWREWLVHLAWLSRRNNPAESRRRRAEARAVRDLARRDRVGLW